MLLEIWISDHHSFIATVLKSWLTKWKILNGKLQGKFG